MDNLSEQFSRELLMEARGFLGDEDIQRLREAVYRIIEGYQITKECTALSVDIASPNMWYLEQFIAIKMLKGLSKNSLKNYQNAILNLFSIVLKPVNQMCTNDIRYFLAVKAKNGCSKVTLNNYLRAFRSFFSTLQNEEYIQLNPTAKIDTIKEERVEKKPLSDMDVEKIRKYFSDKPREKAILEMLLSTGCRVSELVSLNRADVTDNKVIVTGKGNKQRPVYINATARFALMEYLKTRSDENEALFIGCRHGSHKEFARLDKGRIEQEFREAGNLLGIEKVHPHRFRRTMATNALRSGMPIEQVSRILGHEQLTTTQIYAKSEDSDIAAAHRKYVR